MRKAALPPEHLHAQRAARGSCSSPAAARSTRAAGHYRDNIVVTAVPL